METIIKDLPIPKEIIEVQEAIQQVAEPESNGLSGGQIAIVVIIVAGALSLLAKAKCKFKK